MHRRPCTFILQPTIAAALLALGASGTALADDNSMSVLTGDSYAYFNNLDYSPGKFNVARARQVSPEMGVATLPPKDSTKPKEATEKADKPVHITLPSPFSDNKGA